MGRGKNLNRWPFPGKSQAKEGGKIVFFRIGEDQKLEQNNHRRLGMWGPREKEKDLVFNEGRVCFTKGGTGKKNKAGTGDSPLSSEEKETRISYITKNMKWELKS